MKPFLKWAGGKYRVVPKIQSILPQGKRLIEPFVGAGSVFLNTDFNSYLLADTNEDLINLFNLLKEEKSEFIDYADSFFSDENFSEESFYSLREKFNVTKDIRLKSALFLYLNKHCFNGLCRYNSKGQFNVPYGRLSKPKFPKNEMLEFVLKADKAFFMKSDYIETMEEAIVGDVVYCDPPYVPLSKTSHFTNYVAGGFNEPEQIKLADMARKLQKKGIVVLISNHDTEFTREIYKGAKILEFDVQRHISCDGSNRKKANELIALFD